MPKVLSSRPSFVPIYSITSLYYSKQSKFIEQGSIMIIAKPVIEAFSRRKRVSMKENVLMIKVFYKMAYAYLGPDTESGVKERAAR